MGRGIIGIFVAFAFFVLIGNVNASYIMGNESYIATNDGANDNKPEDVQKFLELYEYLFNVGGGGSGSEGEGGIQMLSAEFKFDPKSNQSGTWSSPGPVDFITVKAGNQYAVYEVGGATSGTWNTLGLTVGNGNTPELSHITFWTAPKGYEGPGGGGGDSSAVPEPTTMALLFGGLGVLGYNTFRKKFAKK